MAFQHPAKTYRLVFFDCDSTLASIEGIDELARLKGQSDHIADLTRRAMEGELRLEDVFAERLALLKPTRADLNRLARAYAEHTVGDAKEVIAALRAAGCSVQVISGGLLFAVQEFARTLGLRSQDVCAVPILLDQLSGQWWRYENHRYGGNPDERYLAFAPTPLAETDGKRKALAGLASPDGESMLVGDGITDLEARDAVKLFVGFGGVARRERVAAEADVYVEAARLSAVVPLALAPKDADQLSGTQHAEVLRRGLEDIERDLVKFKKV